MSEPYLGSWFWLCCECGKGNVVTLGKDFVGSRTGKVRAPCTSCGAFCKIRMMPPGREGMSTATVYRD